MDAWNTQGSGFHASEVHAKFTSFPGELWFNNPDAKRIVEPTEFMAEPVSPAAVSDFSYEQLFSGVHILTFRSYSHEAADQCYEAFVTIFRVTMPGETARILVDTSFIRHLNPSIIAAVAKRIMDARTPFPPRAVAVVLNSKSMFLVLSGVIRRVAGAYGVPVYVGTSYDEALAWLEDRG